MLLAWTVHDLHKAAGPIVRLTSRRGTISS